MIKQIILSTFLLTSFSVAAEELNDKYTKLTFSEKVEKEVPQDSVRAVLSFQSEGKTSAKVQDEVNKSVAHLVSFVKADSKIKQYTGNYNVRPRWNSRTERNDGFIATQQLTLESSDKDAILKWVARAQKDDFRVESLSYYLSKKAAKATHDELIAKALDLVKHRAKIVAENLGRESYHISEINVNYNNMNQPVRHMRMEMMADSMGMAKSSTPTVEGTTQAVSVSLNATVFLDVK